MMSKSLPVFSQGGIEQGLFPSGCSQGGMREGRERLGLSIPDDVHGGIFEGEL